MLYETAPGDRFCWSTGAVRVLVLDRTVLWHGSLNLLASPGPTDLMMRLTDPAACERVGRVIERAQGRGGGTVVAAFILRSVAATRTRDALGISSNGERGRFLRPPGATLR